MEVICSNCWEDAQAQVQAGQSQHSLAQSPFSSQLPPLPPKPAPNHPAPGLPSAPSTALPFLHGICKLSFLYYSTNRPALDVLFDTCTFHGVGLKPDLTLYSLLRNIQGLPTAYKIRHKLLSIMWPISSDYLSDPISWPHTFFLTLYST